MKWTTIAIQREILDGCLKGDFDSGDVLTTGHLWTMVFGSSRTQWSEDVEEAFETVIDTIEQEFPEIFQIQYRFYEDIEDVEPIVINSNEVAFYRHDRKLIDVVTGEQICQTSSEIYRDVVLL